MHAPDRDAWRVLYRLPEAVREVAFVRPGAPARVQHWTLVTPGLAVRGEPDAERVVASDGRAFDGFELDIATYEIHPEKDFNEPYMLAMANAGKRMGKGTNGSQFFITTGATSWLQGKHTIFGEVVDGPSREVVDRIGSVPTGPNDKPHEDVVINSVTIED